MDNIITTDVNAAFMSRALELARQGRGKVSPNPMVGCVLVKDGEIIGEGYHEKFGGAHAEVSACQNARQDPIDSTVYVTLEPCCITGKTPPCSDALIHNSIAEVYIGMLDPNPEINGKGVEELEKAVFDGASPAIDTCAVARDVVSASRRERLRALRRRLTTPFSTLFHAPRLCLKG